MWGQVPAIAGAVAGTTMTLILPDGERARVPRVPTATRQGLALMAGFERTALGRALPALEALGIVGAQELPLIVVPDAPAALDGWRFA